METTEKTHWKKQFNFNYMGAYSLPEGKDQVVTIKLMKKEKVKNQQGKEEECFVCYFTDSDKPMILNKTNCKAIEKLHGTAFIEDWAGKKIQLYSAKVKAFGEVTDALRIRDTKPMEQFDNREAIIALNDCKTRTELQDIWKKLSKQSQSDTEVIQLKETLKNKLK